MTIVVTTPRSTYEVRVEHGAREGLAALVDSSSQVAIIHPEELAEVANGIRDTLDTACILIPVPSGESAKTAEVLRECWTSLAAAGFTRDDVIVGLGGGTATDLAGFVAATWLRGVHLVSMPTTVLAMVDAAVGGKTGINLPAGKNLVGAFHEPKAVLCDLDLLTGLPSEEVRAGLAEVIKCGFIADPEILALAAADLQECQDVTSSRFADITRRAIRVKADVVGNDLTERTSSGTQVGREALNYGHTLGHAIEAHHDFALRHGEAISIGMMWMAHVSHDLLGLDDDMVALHADLLGGLGLPLTHAGDAWPALRRAMSLDKKARGATLRLIGLRGQGQPVVLEAPDETVLESCFRRIADQPG